MNLPFSHFPSFIEHHRYGMLSRGNRIPPRGVHHDHALLGGRRLVDVVRPAARPADHLDPGHFLEYRCGCLRRTADHHAVIVVDDRGQFLRRHLPLDVDLDSFPGEYVDSYFLQVVEGKNFHLRILLIFRG
jgi:hypothetical protein